MAKEHLMNTYERFDVIFERGAVHGCMIQKGENIWTLWQGLLSIAWGTAIRPLSMPFPNRAKVDAHLQSILE